MYRCIQALDGETLTNCNKNCEPYGIPPKDI